MYRCSICPNVTPPGQRRLRHGEWGVCRDCHSDLLHGADLTTLVRQRSRPLVVDKTPAGQHPSQIAPRAVDAFTVATPIPVPPPPPSVPQHVPLGGGNVARKGGLGK